LTQFATSKSKNPATSRRLAIQLWRGLIFPIKLLWGMAFCQGLVGSILVAGWTNRATQRTALKFWWKRRADSLRQLSLHSFLEAEANPRDHRSWPNWFIDSRFIEKLRAFRSRPSFRGLAAILRALFISLALNFRLGFRAALNTALLVAPAGLLWWFGWYDGWNNSFSKGYEQAAVGPLISIIGIFWFITVMFYLPIAQARQAVTGDWRSFFQFQLIRKIVRLKWLACAGLAILYSALAVPLMVFKIYPMFVLQKNPDLANLGGPEIIKFLNSYFFWRALWLFPAYLLLKQLAGRIYASGVLELTQTGMIDFSQLAPGEQATLTQLGLAEKKSAPPRHIAIRIIAWAGTRVGRIVTAIIVVLAWFAFVGQIYVGEFFAYHGAVAWLNQPLILLPWFHLLPSALKPPGHEVVFLLLLLAIIAICSALFRAFRAFRMALFPAATLAKSPE
jgi:hypothetical protein